MKNDAYSSHNSITKFHSASFNNSERVIPVLDFGTYSGAKENYAIEITFFYNGLQYRLLIKKIPEEIHL